MSGKRRRHEEHENHERWLVSYADFITLLFAFFVVLYATSQADIKKQEEFQQSFRQAVMAGVGFGMDGGSRFDELNDPRNNSMIKPPFESFPPAGSASREVYNYVEKKVEENLSEGASGEAVKGVRHDAVGVRIELASSQIFASGSANLVESSLGTLEKLGELLSESNRRIIIEGHTDNEPIKTERYPSNWELSAARATKIVRYLIARHKIPSSRLTAVAYADQKPLVPNTSEENRARNRRIEIMIVTDDKTP